MAQNNPCLVSLPPHRLATAVLFLVYKITVIMNNETQIKNRVDNFVKAVQEKNWDGVLAWHHPDIVMFDVPPPFQSIGFEAYRKTWEHFFHAAERGERSFQLVDLHV